MIKNFITSAFFLLVFASIVFSQRTLSADEVLQKSLSKINSLKTVKYKYVRELNYPSTNYLDKKEAESFIDFTETDNPLRARYQFDGKDKFVVFNGSVYFILNKTKKTIEVINKPSESKHANSGFFPGSPIFLKVLLGEIIQDKTINKTLTQTPKNHIIEFHLEKRWVDSFGKILADESISKELYRITIAKKNALQIETLRILNQTDFIKNTLLEINLNPIPPSHLSWNISSYQNEYQPDKPRKKQIAVGEVAPEIALTSFETKQKASLSDYKGKVVMLEFWTFYCGPCQAAVPKLNELNKKFKDKNFKTIGINKGDSDNKIALFKEKFQPNFEFWTGGDKVAEESYGIYSTPIVLLIDKEGKVIFSAEFIGNEAKIEEIIAQNL
jgi:thiol-disulfide isomerase/thioredoxin